MTRAVVLDTNVLVSALLTSDSDAPTSRILDAVLAGRLRMILSLDLLAEYREVLLRPAIRKRHGLSEDEVDELLAELADLAAFRETRPVSDTERRKDLHLHRLCEAAEEAVLVTGDEELRLHGPAGVEVLSPKAFVSR
jgi:putative PIN family toxin of toxin-antitoxin system